MKRLILCSVLALGFTLASTASPCPTGFNAVQSSWFQPSNTDTFTLCGCQAVRGQSASGNCNGSTGSSGSNPDQ